MNWRWISQQALVLLHGESLAIQGGREGLYSKGLLESARMRPQNIVVCAEPFAAWLRAHSAARA